MLRAIGAGTPPQALPAGTRAEPSREPDFAQRLGAELRETAELVERAESTATSLAQGGAGSVETILALSRAELALRHVVSVRNRLLESYQEIMRLPL
jgi:flagellar hook-basal body complex protein FliE